MTTLLHQLRKLFSRSGMFGLGAGLGLATFQTAAGAPTSETIAPRASTAGAHVTYMRYCAWCHGARGDGRGVSSHKFDVVATDFSAGAYKCRTTASGTPPSDNDLRRSIQWGLGGTGMPSFSAIGPSQIENLVATLKSFSPSFKKNEARAPISIPPETPDDASSVGRGAELYTRLQCGNCHGSNGTVGKAAGTLKNDNGTGAQVTEISAGHPLKCGDSSTRIYTTLMTGLDGTPMASYAETMEPAEAWDLTHFVRSLR